jgi:hypothetical protein
MALVRHIHRQYLGTAPVVSPPHAAVIHQRRRTSDMVHGDWCGWFGDGLTESSRVPELFLGQAVIHIEIGGTTPRTA